MITLKEESPLPRYGAEVKIEIAVDCLFEGNMSWIIEKLDGSQADWVTPSMNLIAAITAKELKVPVAKDVKLQPKHAMVIISFLLYLSAAIPQIIPAIENDKEKHAPDKRP